MTDRGVFRRADPSAGRTTEDREGQHRSAWLAAAATVALVGVLTLAIVRLHTRTVLDDVDEVLESRRTTASALGMATGDSDLGVLAALEECIQVRRLMSAQSLRSDEARMIGQLSARLERCSAVLQASPEEALDRLRELANNGPSIAPREYAMLLATMGGRGAAAELEATFDPDWPLVPGEAVRVATVLSELDRLSPRGQDLMLRMMTYRDPLLDCVLRTALTRLLTRCDSDSADAQFLRAQLAQIEESTRAAPECVK